MVPRFYFSLYFCCLFATTQRQSLGDRKGRTSVPITSTGDLQDGSGRGGGDRWSQDGSSKGDKSESDGKGDRQDNSERDKGYPSRGAFDSRRPQDTSGRERARNDIQDGSNERNARPVDTSEISERGDNRFNNRQRGSFIDRGRGGSARGGRDNGPRDIREPAQRGGREGSQRGHWQKKMENNENKSDSLRRTDTRNQSTSKDEPAISIKDTHQGKSDQAPGEDAEWEGAGKKGRAMKPEQ